MQDKDTETVNEEADKPACQSAVERPESTFEQEGVVYRRTPDGLVLEDAQECTTRTYRVLDGTIEIGRLAFAGNTYLEMIAIPQGVRSIGDSAFSACENLTAAILPDTLERIDDWAFFGSSLEMVRIPARCTHLGQCALVADGGGREELWTGGRSLNLYEVDIAEGNPVFYLASDVLCARGTAPDGGDVAVLYIGPATSVSIPDGVTEIAPMAFANASTIDELTIPGSVKWLRPSALALAEPPRRIVVGLQPPVSGHDKLDLRPPRNEAGLNAVNRMFETDTISPRLIMAEMDRSILNQNDHYARYRSMLERLADPIFLADDMAGQFTAFLRGKIWTVCQLFRDRDYLEGYHMLSETGVLDDVTMTRVIDQASAEGATDLVANLLQLKHERKPAADDFEI
jgi:hypothetical protein